MLFMVSSEELLTIFVALELTSLSLYILTAFNKESVKSSEAALKYYLFGGMSAGFTLFGLSLIYGLSGSTFLSEIAGSLRGRPVNPLLIAALVLTLVGFGFKVAAAPFHLWAPDAYQGAPTPSAALIAWGSNWASLFLCATLFTCGSPHAKGWGAWWGWVGGWVPGVALIAALSILVGNLAAIVQSNVKRLLAYSAIAHGGYALLSVAANSAQGLTSLVYYVITYGITVVGALAVVHIVEQWKGEASLRAFAGLNRRAPLLSFCMLVFMLSLAGIPPLAGFFGKFYVFAAALKSGNELGLLWLVILALAMSAVSLYYYLQVLKQIYVVDPAELEPAYETPRIGTAAVAILAIIVIVLGCSPDLLLRSLVVGVQVAGL
jgi:NADH-quinone oxidoreductase subunit N